MMLFVTLLLVTSMTVKAPSACIPPGALIDYAAFSIYVNGWNQTVWLHRITAPWMETEVTWNNFGGSYAPDEEGSFSAPTVQGGGRVEVDVTSLVQGWVNGSYPNYGLLLEQGQTNATKYPSSEESIVSLHPKLEVFYTTSSGSASVTIQRLGSEQSGVADAYIYELSPDLNMRNLASTVHRPGQWL